MQDPHQHYPQTYNRPTSDEVAIVIVSNPDEALREMGDQDIAVQYKNGQLQRIPYSHSCYMALRYVLILPFGEQSWHTHIPMRAYLIPLDNNFRAIWVQRQGLPSVDINEQLQRHPILDNDGLRGRSIRVTQLEFYAYWIQIWPRKFSRVLHAGNYSMAYLLLTFPNGHLLMLSGKLLQHFLTDAYACVDTNNLNFLRTHQKELQAEYYSGLIDCVGHDMDTNPEDIGKKMILPSSYTGSPRALKALYQDAMAIISRFGGPDFFVTFTCNPKWCEIEENLLPGQSAQD